jgi:hypothetical protein
MVLKASAAIVAMLCIGSSLNLKVYNKIFLSVDTSRIGIKPPSANALRNSSLEISLN